MSYSNWGRLLLGGLLLIGGYSLWQFLERSKRTEIAPDDEDGEFEPTGFFELDEQARISTLSERIKNGDACWDIQREARATNRYEDLQKLWVDMLDRVDEDEKTGISFADPAFKEQLLYIIRDGLEPDSPLLEQLFAAYEAEGHQYTRMRIVRAIGRIGGRKAKEFLETVSQSNDDVVAEEARRWLRR